MIVTESWPNIVEPWTKRYFYSIGEGELWEMIVAIGEMYLESDKNSKEKNPHQAYTDERRQKR